MAGFFGISPKETKASSTDQQHQSIVVNKHRCPENHPCPSIRVCPANALKQTGYAAPTVDQSKCTKCGKCIRFCPMRAISFQ